MDGVTFSPEDAVSFPTQSVLKALANCPRLRPGNEIGVPIIRVCVVASPSPGENQIRLAKVRAPK